MQEPRLEFPGAAGAQGQASVADSAMVESWGRYPEPEASRALTLDWIKPLPSLTGASSVLPHGQGRSYGDSCLNAGGQVLLTGRLDRFISFDDDSGLLRCESGVTLSDILEFAVPRGWFLPTTPGTKYVSVGGAIANDVHGKNHHRAGSFGRHVVQFELLRSDGSVTLCSPFDNEELFAATIGGLGLTGFILWAEIKLRRVPGPLIESESIKFRSLREYFEIEAESASKYEYTVSWIDCLATGSQRGRGLFMGGNHAWQKHIPGVSTKIKKRPAVPFNAPSFAMSPLVMRLAVEAVYRSQLKRVVRKIGSYDPFFYPLDAIGHWNRMYGKAGVLQHQFVVPHDNAYDVVDAVLAETGGAGEGSFLGVLKTFGDLRSPGMMSFPRPGVTLALDFPMHGEKTLQMLNRLDKVVIEAGGALYPAKDARMSGETFRASFPRWEEFSRYIDPAFSSGFWRRVMADAPVQA